MAEQFSEAVDQPVEFGGQVDPVQQGVGDRAFIRVILQDCRQQASHNLVREGDGGGHPVSVRNLGPWPDEPARRVV